MSRARHEEHRRAKGDATKPDNDDKGDTGIGGVADKKKTESYAGTGSDTEKEAERRKRGGGVHKGKMPHMVHGSAPRHHANRPGRKRGGAMGADSHPMTMASKLEQPEGMKREGHTWDKEDD
jgi:hypothetical protein